MDLTLLCANCGAEWGKHGIDSSHDDAPLMCPLYMKNDGANWDGNYHKWRKWKPKDPMTEAPFVKTIPNWMKIAAVLLLLLIFEMIVFGVVYSVNYILISANESISHWNKPAIEFK